MRSWWNETIKVLRATVVVSRGSEIPDWTNAAEITVNNCRIQPAGTTLSQDGRILGISDGLTAYLPIDADVKTSDRIKFDGQIYTINGEPRTWKSISGNTSHIVLNLERWEG